ncbi:MULTISPECIES: glycosyltransferase family 2 protein [unclassified Psychrobacter]|uniref:glycosyltransferase family 2 protein n=1 Tax=unclassified Psychrobacter TaxID=196806 RepID=UPI0004010173|nr:MULTISPECIES: glycosyltransferase family A protein [unclassified Psychrobacter]
MFSVVIPLYNKEEYILRTVESVLSQSFVDFELIIVDDGSVDSSLEVIKNISDPRVRIIQQANQGVGPARNTGMAEAKYDWIALLDADDAWSPFHLAELVKIINAFPLSKMVSNKVLQLNTAMNITDTEEDTLSFIRVADYFLEAAKDISVIHSSSVAIKKEVFSSIGGFSDAKMGEDLEYWARVALSYPVAISDKITCYYFRGTGGIMESESVAARKRTGIKSLKDLSPSVNMLVERATENPAILKRNNVKKYINSRLFNGVKASVFNKDIKRAKKLSSLSLPQLDKISIFLFTFNLTPEPILKNTFKIYSYIKN